MRKFLLYGHGGILNHGSEAILISVANLIRKKHPDAYIMATTHFYDYDKNYDIGIDEWLACDLKAPTYEESYKKALEKVTQDVVCVFIAADNLCYRNWQRYSCVHEKALNNNVKSIMINASIDEQLIDEEMTRFLHSFELITAREQLTYHTLIKLNCKNVVKIPDVAFLLKPQKIDFYFEDFVAINLSPLVANRNPMIVSAYSALIDYILNETVMDVVLVPHVLVLVDNDYDILKTLSIENDRVTLISDKLSAGEYKYIISKARFGVFARTHASIAAYSSCVPTAVVGYSVKSKGIAIDLKMTEYTISAQEITDTKYLVMLFKDLMLNEDKIRQSLKKSTSLIFEEFSKGTIWC